MARVDVMFWGWVVCLNETAEGEKQTDDECQWWENIYTSCQGGLILQGMQLACGANERRQTTMCACCDVILISYDYNLAQYFSDCQCVFFFLRT